MLRTSNRFSTRGLACVMFVAALMTIPAFADTVSGLPTSPVTQQDKVWSSFATSGATLPTDLQTTFSFTQPPSGDLHTVTFSGTFLPGLTYTISYTVSVVASSPNQIVKAFTGFVNNGTPDPTLTTTLSNGVTLTNAVPSATFPGVTTLNVTDTFTAGSATTAISNTYGQATVPEPTSLALLGSGLVGIARILRKRSN